MRKENNLGNSTPFKVGDSLLGRFPMLCDEKRRNLLCVAGYIDDACEKKARKGVDG